MRSFCANAWIVLKESKKLQDDVIAFDIEERCMTDSSNYSIGLPKNLKERFKKNLEKMSLMGL